MTTLSVPAAGITYTGEMVEVPVAFGMSADTPAGAFGGCVGVARLLSGTDNTGKEHWEKSFVKYASGVGPVEYWRRSADPPDKIETEYTHWGYLEQADVGGVHYPH